MLIIMAQVRKSCKKGVNLAELHQIGARQVQAQFGSRTEPIMSCKHLEGTPLGSLSDVPAPIDLEADDRLAIESGEGDVVVVVRDGKPVWYHAALLERQAASALKRSPSSGVTAQQFVDDIVALVNV